jgi:2-octaprenylphenol hydroxylase
LTEPERAACLKKPKELIVIVIAGGGMVGAALACALKDTGYTITLIEAQDKSCFEHIIPAINARKNVEPGSAVTATGAVTEFGSRVSALTLASRTLLEKIGAWPIIAQSRICPYREMLVWDAEGTGRIHFDAAEMFQRHLGHIVENQIVVSALHQCLREAVERQQSHSGEGQNGGLELRFGAAIKSMDCQTEAINLRLDNGDQLSARLLVAADGANSKLRMLSGLPTREWDYEHHAIIANVQTAHGHDFCARQRFIESGPLAFLPLATDDGDDHFSSIVWSLTPDLAQRYMAQDEKAFCASLEQALNSTQVL